jgi:hypothetical protein
MRKIIYLFIVTVILSCANQEKKLPENFDFGKTNNGSYKNDYFNMELLFDSNWVIKDKQQMNSLAERGRDLITSENKKLKSIVKAAQVNTAYLLAIFKYKDGAAVEYNPSFMVVAENTKNLPGIKTGSDYLFHAKKLMKLMKQTQIQYKFEKEVYERVIGKSSFHIMEVKVDYMGKNIIQEYISAVNKGFSLSFIISYTSEEERDELYEIIDNVKI